MLAEKLICSIGGDPVVIYCVQQTQTRLLLEQHHLLVDHLHRDEYRSSFLPRFHSLTVSMWLTIYAVVQSYSLLKMYVKIKLSLFLLIYMIT